MLNFLDYFFTIFHSVVIVFNLLGWIFKPLRKANLILLLLTGGSWFILGIFYGIGYCPLTDWHWQVLHKLGVTHLPNSYVTYLFYRIFNITISDNTADLLIIIFYFSALVFSVYFNFRKKPKQRN